MASRKRHGAKEANDDSNGNVDDGSERESSFGESEERDGEDDGVGSASCDVGSELSRCGVLETRLPRVP